MLSLALIVSSTFVLSVAMGMCAVLFPLTLGSQGVSTSLIGIILSSETVAAIALCFLFPSILHVFGMKIGMLLSTAIRAPALFFLAISSNEMVWLTGVFLNGVGCYTLLVLLQTWINSIPFKTNKGLMVSLFGIAISLGMACGPLVLRLADALMPSLLPPLTALFGPLGMAMSGNEGELTNQFKFFLAALLSTIASLPVIMGLLLVPAFEFKQKPAIWHAVLQAKGPMFAIAMGGVSFFGVTAFITLYGMRNNLSLEDSALLLTSFMLGGLILSAPLTWLSDIVDRRYVIVGAAFSCMVCAVYLPIAIYVNYQAWILLFVWGGVIGALYATCLALIGERFDGEALVAANAGYSLMDAVGGTAGICAIGFFMDSFGSDGLPYVIMFASIAYFSFALTRYRVV